jgi:hypothetical protein
MNKIKWWIKNPYAWSVNLDLWLYDQNPTWFVEMGHKILHPFVIRDIKTWGDSVG